MRWMVAIAMLCAGCDVEAEPHDHARESTSFMGDEPPCPERTIAFGDAFPVGHELWCALPSGTKHGYYKRWHPNGIVQMETEYSRGLECGVRRQYKLDGSLQYEGDKGPCAPL